jgi:hypothetical protein
MKKKLTHVKGCPPKPLTEFECELLQSWFNLPGWQFDDLIKPHCILIQESIIDYTPPKDGGTYETACIYGLIGFDSKTGERVIANIFVRERDLLYQFDSMGTALQLIEVLRKQNKRIKYLDEKESKKQQLKAA